MTSDWNCMFRLRVCFHSERSVSVSRVLCFFVESVEEVEASVKPCEPKARGSSRQTHHIHSSHRNFARTWSLAESPSHELTFSIAEGRFAVHPKPYPCDCRIQYGKMEFWDFLCKAMWKAYFLLLPEDFAHRFRFDSTSTGSRRLIPLGRNRTASQSSVSTKRRTTPWAHRERRILSFTE